MEEVASAAPLLDGTKAAQREQVEPQVQQVGVRKGGRDATPPLAAPHHCIIGHPHSRVPDAPPAAQPADGHQQEGQQVGCGLRQHLQAQWAERLAGAV